MSVGNNASIGMNSPPASPSSGAYAYRWHATVAAMIGMMTPIMASTMANVAVADIMGAYGVGQDRVHWLQTGSLAAITVCMLLTPWFVNNIGPRYTYIGACALFTVGSVLGHFAPTFDWVVIARVMQGACTGVLQPLAMQVIFTVFPPEERGKALGLFGFGTMMGPAFGPIYGGVLVDVFDWHFVFTGTIPLMLLGGVIAARYLPGRRENPPDTPLSWPSLILVGSAIIALLNGLTVVQREGTASVLGMSLLLAAGVLLLLFIEYECRARSPLLNMSLFTHRSFAVVSMVGLVYGAGMFGSFYLLPVFVRTVQGFTGTKTGMLLLCADAITFLLFPFSGWLAHRISPLYPIAIGMAMFCISSIGMSQIEANSGFWMMVGWTMLGRAGLGLTVPAITSAALQDLDSDLLPYGAGTMNFVRMLGGALGVSCVALVLDSRTAHYASGFAAAQTDTTGATGAMLDGVVASLHTGGVSTAEQVPYAFAHLSDVITLHAYALSYQDAYLVLALAFAVSSLGAFFLLKPRPRQSA